VYNSDSTHNTESVLCANKKTEIDNRGRTSRARRSCYCVMVPESVWNILAGGLIGFFGSLGVLVIRDWLETGKRRKLLIDAIDAATNSCASPAIMAAFTGSRHFSPAEQFLATFWRDLPLLGTETQMMVVTLFSTLIDATRIEGGPSKALVESQMELLESVLRLLEKERKGKRQNITRLSQPSLDA